MARLSAPLKSEYLKIILPPFLALSVFGLVTSGISRETILRAGLSIGGEMYDRQYDEESNTVQTSNGVVTTTEDIAATQADDEYDRLRIAPLIDISSVTARDEIQFRYVPSFRYEFDSEDSDVDHDLLASYSRFLTQSWQVTLSERFRYSDVVEGGAEIDNASGVEVTDREGRRTYRTNEVSLISEYTYLEDSLVTVGYIYNILDNVEEDDGVDYEDYDRHEALMSVAHRFDSIWRLEVLGRYIRGLYDEPSSVNVDGTQEEIESDLNEYRFSTTLDAALIEHQPLSLQYQLYVVDYDEEQRENSHIHDATLGWQWTGSKDWFVSLAAGPSYEKTGGEEGQWGYNGSAEVQYNFERGLIKLSADGGYDRDNFSGTDEHGLQQYWQARADFSYELYKDLNFNVFSLYRYEDQDEITLVSREEGTDDFTTLTQTLNRERYVAGTSLVYQFLQWYSFDLRYTYTKQESERVDDSYDEHLVALILSFEKDLFNW